MKLLVLGAGSMGAALARRFADPMQAINAWKNVAIAGGCLMLAAHGPGALSVDARRPGRAGVGVRTTAA